MPLLLSDMEARGWLIDSFPFTYNHVETIVILKRFRSGETKRKPYDVVKLEFIYRDNAKCSIHAYADFFNVRFETVKQFVDFFHIIGRNFDRDLFDDFSQYFAPFIPTAKIVRKTDRQERELLGSRAEGNNPDAIYCFDVRRSGFKDDGTPKTRSIENDNKAAVLRPELYQKYKGDMTLSFFFSANPQDERTDEEIMATVAQR